MTKPKAVIYDNDGMLMHGGRFSEQYSREFGVDLAVMSRFFETSFKLCLIGKADLREELAKVLEDWEWKGTADELMRYWFSIGDTLYEDTHASVGKLKEQGVVVCLATNQEKYRLQYLTKKFSYDSLFDEIFSSSELGALKHSEEGLEKISRKLKEAHSIADRGEVMYWDDRESQIKNLGEGGFNAQLYTDYPAFRKTLEEYGLRL
ncbi:MAG: HAD family hydrolase [bacterium]